jgi:hypothetical protein
MKPFWTTQQALEEQEARTTRERKIGDGDNKEGEWVNE